MAKTSLSPEEVETLQVYLSKIEEGINAMENSVDIIELPKHSIRKVNVAIEKMLGAHAIIVERMEMKEEKKATKTNIRKRIKDASPEQLEEIHRILNGEVEEVEEEEEIEEDTDYGY